MHLIKDRREPVVIDSMLGPGQVSQRSLGVYAWAVACGLALAFLAMVF